MNASSSWRARLELGFSPSGGRTILSHRRHFGPLVVQRPFYPEGGTCHVYLVHPPGGIVGGDQVALDVDVQPGSHALITTPAATRFYRAGPHPTAVLQQELRVKDAALEWLPQETIVFDGARASTRTVVQLEGDACFAGWEVLCLGRPANAEAFHQGSVRQDFHLYRNGQPVLLDRLRLQGASPAFAAAWGLGGEQALGTLLVSPAQGIDLPALRALVKPGVRHGFTIVEGTLLCRALAREAEPIRQLFTELWLRLRPALLGREAIAPRIWAT
jgi:urease accessory protein